MSTARVFAGVNLAVVIVVSLIVGEPYMDEVFHVAQASRFRDWIMSLGSVPLEWDPAITTFPGLYLASWPLTSTVMLRAFNAVLMSGVMLHVVRRLTGSTSTALLIALYPFNYFYHFLYYTDTLATTCVFLALLLMKQRRYTLCGMAGLAAVMCRQTNIVWVFGMSVHHSIQLTRPLVRKRRMTVASIVPVMETVVRDLWVQILTGVAFIFFFKWNNYSIVLGHHEFHSLSFHSAQVNYFVLTVVGAAGPTEWMHIYQSLRKNFRLRRVVVMFLLATAAAEIGTIFHTFVLSDNRHYTFYLHRYLLRHRLVRSVIVPVIVAVCGSHISLFKQSPIGLNKSLFWFCTLAVLVPTPLLEFRYFNLPCSWLLMSTKWTEKQKRSAIRFSILVNAVAIGVFLLYPRVDESGEARRLML